MSELREKYESFISANKLNEGNIHDLLRLCGYSPLETQQFSIPQSFEELEKICQSVKKKYTKEDLLKELKILFDDKYCTKEELKNVLTSGEKLSEREFESFYEQIPSENGVISLESLVNALMNEE